MAASPETLDLSILARKYVKNGWALVPIANGTKGPTGDGWNQQEQCVTTLDDCRRIKANVGLAHAYSGTCVIDLDRFDDAAEWFASKGLELSILWDAMDAVKISSGKPNRGKLLYKLPEGVAPLRSKKLADGALELRCAASNGKTLQDLLPPSIHPDTGRPYEWVYDDILGTHWSQPPVLPAAMLKLWQAVLSPEPAEKAPKSEKESLGLSRDDIRKLIYQEDPDGDYDNWLAVGFAVHHEMRGGHVGLELWDEWSATGAEYPGWEQLEYKWGTFGRGYDGPEKTIRSLMTVHGVATVDDFDVLPEPEARTAARAALFAVCSAGEFAAGPPQQWIIKGVLPKAEIGMIYGESTAGKSFVAMDMLASIARGEPWRGMRTKQLRTVMIIAEGAGGAKARVKAYEQHHQVSLSDFPFGIIQDRPDLFGKSDHRRLAAQIKAWGGADVIVVDTLAQSSAGANENSGEDMGLVLAHCHKLNEETGAMVLLVHHAGKDASRGARGWSGLKGAMDVEIEVTRHPLTGRAIRLSKSKDGDEGQAMGFKLGVVQIGIDEDGDPITSCIVEHMAGAVATVDPKDSLTDHHRAVLHVITEACDMDVAMHVDEVRRAAVPLMKQTGKVDNRMRDAGKAIDKLVALGYIQADENSRYTLKVQE